MVPRMHVDLNALSGDHRYKLLTALVIPRPIAWITSLSATGVVNAAPFSFFNVMGNTPPVIAFGAGYRQPGVPKDTPRNVELAKEFVVNLVDPDCVEAMHASSAPFPEDVSEAAVLGLALLPSLKVKVPRLAISKVQLECRHWGTVQIGDNQILFGLIEMVHVAEGIVDRASLRIEAGRFEAVGRLQGPGWYATTRERIELGPAPTVEQSLARAAASAKVNS